MVPHRGAESDGPSSGVPRSDGPSSGVPPSAAPPGPDSLCVNARESIRTVEVVVASGHAEARPSNPVKHRQSTASRDLPSVFVRLQELAPRPQARHPLGRRPQDHHRTGLRRQVRIVDPAISCCPVRRCLLHLRRRSRPGNLHPRRSSPRRLAVKTCKAGAVSRAFGTCALAVHVRFAGRGPHRPDRHRLGVGPHRERLHLPVRRRQALHRAVVPRRSVLHRVDRHR